MPVTHLAVYAYMPALTTPPTWSPYRLHRWEGRCRSCHGSQLGHSLFKLLVTGSLFLSLRNKGLWHLLLRWFNFFLYPHHVDSDLGLSCWVVHLVLFLRLLLGL